MAKTPMRQTACAARQSPPCPQQSTCPSTHHRSKKLTRLLSATSSGPGTGESPRRLGAEELLLTVQAQSCRTNAGLQRHLVKLRRRASRQETRFPAKRRTGRGGKARHQQAAGHARCSESGASGRSTAGCLVSVSQPPRTSQLFKKVMSMSCMCLINKRSPCPKQ